jgi:hypothetical protein
MEWRHERHVRARHVLLGDWSADPLSFFESAVVVQHVPLNASHSGGCYEHLTQQTHARVRAYCARRSMQRMQKKNKHARKMVLSSSASVLKELARRKGWTLDDKRSNSILGSGGASASSSPRLDTTLFWLDDAESNAIAAVTAAGFPCAGQLYSHVPGERSFVRSDFALKRLRAYSAVFLHDTQRAHLQCFRLDDVMPASFLLDNVADCRRFFRLVQTEERHFYGNDDDVLWRQMRYDSSAAADDDDDDDDVDARLLARGDVLALAHQFGNGSKCSSNSRGSNPFIVQRYIQEPLLLDGGHKSFLHAYMTIASTNPLVVFFARGAVQRSAAPYTTSIATLAAHVIDSSSSSNNNNNNNNASSSSSGNEMSFDAFQQYITRAALGPDDFVATYVVPEMKRIMMHLVTASRSALSLHRGTFGVYRLRFALDARLKLRFLGETRSTRPTAFLPPQLLDEVLDLQTHLLRNDFAPAALSSAVFTAYRQLEPVLYDDQTGRGDARHYFDNALVFPACRAFTDKVSVLHARSETQMPGCRVDE